MDQKPAKLLATVGPVSALVENEDGATVVRFARKGREKDAPWTTAEVACLHILCDKVLGDIYTASSRLIPEKT